MKTKDELTQVVESLLTLADDWAGEYGYQYDDADSPVRATLKRALESALSELYAEDESPCEVCGNEVRGQSGYLSCECPAPMRPQATNADGISDERIDALIYTQYPTFDEAHEGPSLYDVRSIVRAAIRAAVES